MFKRIVPAMVPVLLASPVYAQSGSDEGTTVMHRDPLDRVGTRAAALRLGQAGQPNTAFNPAISVILDGAYFNDFNREVGSPEGFGGGHDHSHGHGHGAETGFSLRETEVTFSASVDNYLDAMLVLSGSDHGFEVEEAYITTRSLPAGLQIKAGKFLSDIGYINKQHPHDWDFFDRPMVNEYLFGDHGLQETGAQLSWVPATDNYMRLGLEVLQGQTHGIAAYQGDSNHTILGFDGDPGSEGPTRLRWRANNGLSHVSGPRLVTSFVKFAPDLGFDNAVQFGLSYGQSRAWQDTEAHSSGRLETWDGDAWFWGADVIFRHDAGQAMGHGSWSLQAEYFYRNIDADYASRSFSNSSTLVPTVSGGMADVFSGTAKQDGLYVQGVYGIAPRWQLGLRAEAIGLTNDSLEPIRSSNSFESFHESKRYSGAVTFRPTEFSYFRTQLNYNDFDHSNSRWTLALQFNISLGVHGAHQF